jgi:hypothetical protein
MKQAILGIHEATGLQAEIKRAAATQHPRCAFAN